MTEPVKVNFDLDQMRPIIKRGKALGHPLHKICDALWEAGLTSKQGCKLRPDTLSVIAIKMGFREQWKRGLR